jgi:stage II sporulation protein AA (anti-sigma F factor antagonist)
VPDLQLQLTEPSERVLELRLSGEIDLATVEPLRETVQRAIASGGYDSLVIDLLDVGFIDSSGLHVLADANTAMAAAGGTTKIVCAATSLRKIFELTGLDRVLTIVHERASAQASFAA